LIGALAGRLGNRGDQVVRNTKIDSRSLQEEQVSARSIDAPVGG
jgi:hypothetical protein